MPDALMIAAQDAETVTVEMIEVAQKIAGVSFSREERQSIVTRLNASRGYLAGFAFLRTANLGNSAQPAIVFNPIPPGKVLPTGAAVELTAHATSAQCCGQGHPSSYAMTYGAEQPNMACSRIGLRAPRLMRRVRPMRQRRQVNDSHMA